MSNKEFKENKPAILALHGFTGSGQDFSPFMEGTGELCHWVTPDLPGHGDLRDLKEEADYSLASIFNRLDTLIDRLDGDVILLGYSLGARIGLHYALHAKEKLKGIILISGTPGIRKERSQEKRKKEDAKLAEQIPKMGVEAFINAWQEQPLIQSQKSILSSTRKRMIERRMQNSAEGLANSLRFLGQGALPSIWDNLEVLDLPVALFAGEKDVKYCEIATEMSHSLKMGLFLKVPEAGHAPHLENFDYFMPKLQLMVEKIAPQGSVITGV